MMEKVITTVNLREQNVSPKKARLVMNLIRMKSATRALEILETTNKKSAGLALSLLKSGIDAAKKKDFKEEELIICESLANEGRRMKRMFIRARGRSTGYVKKMSHLKISLGKISDFKKEDKKTNKKDSTSSAVGTPKVKIGTKKVVQNG
jgi:large subunit ribosomal protein L22